MPEAPLLQIRSLTTSFYTDGGLLPAVEDVNLDSENPWEGFDLINEELEQFDPELAQRRQIEVVNKIDLRTPEELAALKARAQEDGRDILFISAREQIGLEPLVERMWKLRDELDFHEPLVHYQDEVVVDEEFPDIEVIWTRE